MIRKKAKQRFGIQKNGAKLRGIEWNMSFEEWDHWWMLNGIDKNFPTLHSAEQLCMCRKGDQGSYSLDNVYCASRKQNAIDNRQNKHYGLEGSKNPMFGKPAVTARAVKTPKGTFTSQKTASKILGINISSLKTLIKRNPQEYSYV